MYSPKPFLSTSPVWGTTKSWLPAPCSRWRISIHVPRMGDDTSCPGRPPRAAGHFYPRPPYGGRRWRVYTPAEQWIISIHVPRMGDDAGQVHSRFHLVISIHVPRMGDDCGHLPGRQRLQYFYPRPPYGGRPMTAPTAWPLSDFYPRPPYGGRPSRSQKSPAYKAISIHVPRMGDDFNGYGVLRAYNAISIHVPRMGDDATISNFLAFSKDISIHVPRMGDDWWPCDGISSTVYFYPRPPYGGRLLCSTVHPAGKSYFYPRPPYGGRRQVPLGLCSLPTFLSTSPVWGTTAFTPTGASIAGEISIHVPRMGDDLRALPVEL